MHTTIMSMLLQINIHKSCRLDYVVSSFFVLHTYSFFQDGKRNEM